MRCRGCKVLIPDGHYQSRAFELDGEWFCNRTCAGDFAIDELPRYRGALRFIARRLTGMAKDLAAQRLYSNAPPSHSLPPRKS